MLSRSEARLAILTEEEAGLASSSRSTIESFAALSYLCDRVDRGKADFIEVAGGNPRRAETRRKLGVVQHAVGFPRSLTVGEIVGGAAARRGCPPEAASQAITEMGLAGLEKRRAAKLSGGQQQRLQLAMGLVADPILLVLDEPTEGLDVEARRRFWNTIRRRLDNGAGVLITTHIVDEAAAVADRVVVVDRGRVVADGTPDELRQTLPNRQISVQTEVPVSVIRALDSVEAVDAFEPSTTAVRGSPNRTDPVGSDHARR